MKKNSLRHLGIISTVFLVAITGVCVGQNQRLNKEIQNKQAQIEKLKTELEELNVNTAELNPCPFCEEVPTLFPVNDVFYIECEGCGLKTNFFESKLELKAYWNLSVESETNLD